MGKTSLELFRVPANQVFITNAQFDECSGGYLVNGYPMAETDRKMAEQIIKTMEAFGVFGE